MKCYLVSAHVKAGDPAIAQRIAGTGALSKARRDELMAEFDLKKKQITIDEFEIPTAKPELIKFINALVIMFDETECVVPNPAELSEEDD